MKYRAEIDGLRALAVVPVILFHAGFELFSGGFVGVDVFFVISGYLITTILIEDIENKRFSIVNFYERRARRILPALFFVVLSSFYYFRSIMPAEDFLGFAKSVKSVSLFISNIFFMLDAGYFSTEAKYKPLLHTWSLAVEEQYYILFPIFLILAWRFGKTKVFWMIVIMAAVSLSVSEWGWRNKPTANFYLAPTRAWELFAGAIAAFIVQKRGVQTNNTLALIGLFAIIFSIFFYDEATPFPSVYALVPVLGAVLLVLYAAEGTFAAKVLRTKIFVGIGLVSYSAYLWHQPLLTAILFNQYEIQQSINIQIAFVLILICLSVSTYSFIENPARTSRSKSKLVLTTSAAALTIIFYLGTQQTNIEYLPLNTQSFLASSQPSPLRDRCHIGGYLNPQDACIYNEQHDVTTAILGDSHGVELGYAIAKELDTENEALMHFTFSGCPPSLPGIYDSTCARWTDDVVNFITSNENISHVVLSYRIAYHLSGEVQNAYPNHPEPKPSDEIQKILNSYLLIVERLKNAGKIVTIVVQAPEIPFSMRDVSRAIATNNSDIEDEIIGFEQEYWNVRINEFINFIHQITGVRIVDPAELFCKETHCFAVLERKALYFDNDHMSTYGASLLVPFIVKVD